MNPKIQFLIIYFNKSNKKNHCEFWFCSGLYSGGLTLEHSTEV